MQSDVSSEGLDHKPVSMAEPTEMQKNRFRSHLAAARLGGAVALMLGSPRHRSLPLGYLRRSLIPAMTRGQMSLVEAGREETGEAAPVALLLWAKVSDEVHKRLVEDIDKPMLLDPEEWNSGENFWIIDAIGQERFLAPAIRKLRTGEFKGKTVYYRVREGEGEEATLSVKTLEPAQPLAS